MNIFNRRGQTLIQVLVAMGISVVVMMTTLTIIQAQTRETVALQQKLGAIGLETSLLRAVSDGAICKQIVSTPTSWVFNANLLGSSNSPALALNSIPSSAAPGSAALIEVGKTASAWTSSLTVKSISLSEVTASDSTFNSFSGALKVEFDSSKLIRAIKPITIRVDFSTQPSSPMGNKIVTGCSVSRDEMVIGGFYQYYLQCGNEDGNCQKATPAWTCGNGAGKTTFGPNCNNACRHTNPVTGKCTCPDGYKKTIYFDFARTCGDTFYTDPGAPVSNNLFSICGLMGVMCTK